MNNRQPVSEYVVGFAAMALFAVAAYYLAGEKLDANFASAFGGLATGVGIIVAVITIRRMRESNDFSVITAVCSRFNEGTSYQARGYLFNSFGTHLAKAAQKIFGSDSVASGHVDIQWILCNVTQNVETEKALNTELETMSSGVGRMSALEAAERVLLDFDLIATPFCEGNASAQAAARAWKPVLEKTSEAILPLIAIKTKLRGTTVSYKYHYLKLLQDLKIDRGGLDVPNRP